MAKKQATGNPEEKEPAPPADRVERFTTTLKCGLSPDEVATRADRAANLVSRIGEKTDEAKAAAKHAKSEVDQLNSELRTLSSEVASRVTYRSVECERRYVFAEGLLRETRLDTSDMINSRKMTEAERQLQLPLDDGDHAAKVEHPATPSSWPIANLGAKLLKQHVGEDVFGRAKDGDSPIGLTPAQIEKIISDLKSDTIGSLESLMVGDPLGWHKPIANRADSALVTRIIESLIAFRRVMQLSEQDKIDERENFDEQ